MWPRWPREVVLAVRAGAAKHRDLRRARCLSLDDDLLPTVGSKQMTHVVVDVCRALQNSRRGEQHTSPAKLGAREGLEPCRSLGDGLSNDISRSVSRDSRGNCSRESARCRSEVLSCGNLRLVPGVEVVDELVDEDLVRLQSDAGRRVEERNETYRLEQLRADSDHYCLLNVLNGRTLREGWKHREGSIEQED